MERRVMGRRIRTLRFRKLGSLLTPDVAGAARSSLAMTAGWIACLLAGHSEVVILVAPTAQNVAMLPIRGDYGARLLVLLLLTVVLSLAVFLGSIAGTSVWLAMLLAAFLALEAGVWRHVSAEYGPQLALASGLLFFLAMALPGDWRHALELASWVGLAGLGSLLLQLSFWLIRPQHPLRHAVAESWMAASDLMAAIRAEFEDGTAGPQDYTKKEGAVRASVDRTLLAIGSAGGRGRSGFGGHLDDATQLAARLATRITAFHTALEPLKNQRGFVGLVPTLDSVFRSLTNATRSAALTIITHRPGQLVALEARLRRCSALMRVLDLRLSAAFPENADAKQARELLQHVADLLADIRGVVGQTVDHGERGAGFALRLQDLGGVSLRALGARFNPALQIDPVLVRYTLRVAVLLVAGVGVYRGFAIPHGYWIAFTMLVVLQPDYGSTRQKALQRAVGTLAGSVLGSLLLWVPMPEALLVSLAAVMAFCFGYYVRRRYDVAIFFVTLMLVLMVESMIPVHLDFAVSRLLSVLAGGLAAVLAARLFWPKWERETFPVIIARATRANAGYLTTIADRMVAGEPFTSVAIDAKREAERANSQAVASLQRLLSEPSWQDNDVEEAAARTTANQRITRFITVLGQYLGRRTVEGRAEFTRMARRVGAALEQLAVQFESGNSPVQPNTLYVDLPTGLSESETPVYGQLVRILTEVEAMARSAGSPAE